MTVAAENFGVNLRNTVTTSVPNFVRASTILYSTLFHAMSGMGLRWSAALTGMLAFALAFYSLHGLQVRPLGNCKGDRCAPLAPPRRTRWNHY